MNSNTTFVKVKYICIISAFLAFFGIQIQHLLKLNVIMLRR